VFDHQATVLWISRPNAYVAVRMHPHSLFERAIFGAAIRGLQHDNPLQIICPLPGQADLG
jgi:hypothetical protein